MTLKTEFLHIEYTHELFMSTIDTQPEDKLSLIHYKQTPVLTNRRCEQCK